MTGAASEAAMDCEHCEKSLLDLSYGELDESAAATARGHLEGCASCRAAFQKIEIGRAFARKLELEPAPSLAKVLAAAREQAAASRAAREQPPEIAPSPRTAPREEATTDEGGLAGWLRRLGAFVMGPQLGVATVLMLVVGIGLWYLPQLGGSAGRGTPPLLEPDPQQTSETSALAPAEPLQLTHDPRTGRVTVEREDDPSATNDAVPRRETPREDPARTEDERAVESRAARLEEALAEVEETIPTAEAPGQVQDDSLPELTTAAGSYEGEPLPPTADVPPTMPQWAAPSTTSATPAAPSTERAGSTSQRFEMDSVPGGPSADDLGAAALHGQARQLAVAGRCADSVARYQQLQSRYPAYPEGGRASVEMADCLRRLGRTREARAALERASRSPVAAVASAARRQIVEMDTADRAVQAAPVEQPTSH